MNYFTFNELIYSRAAEANGLDNTPGEQERLALAALVEKVLDPLREALGEPIRITSGYRSPEVNRLVGGVSTSQHVKGEAADCTAEVGPERLLKLIRFRKIPFDQAIVYKKRNFLHVSYRADGKNRKQLIIDN